MSHYVDSLLISYRKPYLSKGKNYDDFRPIFHMRKVKFGLKLIHAMGPIWVAYRLDSHYKLTYDCEAVLSPCQQLSDILLSLYNAGGV